MHALETALRPYRALGERSEDVDGLLEEARESIERGALTQALSPLRARLGALQNEVKERLEGFETRLDAALGAFEPVSRLNSDETATVKRTLHHLDTQRGAFYRVSLGVQLELEASLRGAETLIKDLQAQFEATRAVADFLVSDGLFDDMLGLFDAPQAASPDHTAPLQSLLEGYLHHPEVRSAAVISDRRRTRQRALGRVSRRASQSFRRFGKGGGVVRSRASRGRRGTARARGRRKPRHRRVAPPGGTASCSSSVRWAARRR